MAAACLPLDFFGGLTPASVYRTASTGDTRAAILPGLRQEMRTVMSENTVAKRKISGLIEMVSCMPSSCERMSGTSCAPIRYPATRPIGMPISESRYACRRIMRRICLPVVPMVFKRP